MLDSLISNTENLNVIGNTAISSAVHPRFSLLELVYRKIVKILVTVFEILIGYSCKINFMSSQSLAIIIFSTSSPVGCHSFPSISPF